MESRERDSVGFEDVYDRAEESVPYGFRDHRRGTGSCPGLRTCPGRRTNPSTINTKFQFERDLETSFLDGDDLDAIYLAFTTFPKFTLLSSTEPLRQHPRIWGTIPPKESDPGKCQIRGRNIPSLPSEKTEDHSCSLPVKSWPQFNASMLPSPNNLFRHAKRISLGSVR